MIKKWIIRCLYRRKAIAIIFNDDEFLVDQLVSYSQNDWNFPGGGVERGETDEDGLLRELQEELGTNKFKIVFKSKYQFRYNWPWKIVFKDIFKKGRFYLGQSQSQFVVKFIGKKDEISPDKSEIRKVKWIKKSEFGKYLRFPNQLKNTQDVLKEFKASMK